MKLGAYFKYFLENTVNLNAARINQLNQRVEAIETFLMNDGELGGLIADVIPQGSYAHRTIIRPLPGHEFDADLLLHLEEQTEWEAKDYVGNVYAALLRSKTYQELVSRRTRCVLVDYANEFHVDVVPYLIRTSGNFITNRNENVFELTNPEGYNDWLDGQNRTANGHLIEGIRRLKYLRDFKGTFGVKSVILTTLLGNAVNSANIWNDARYYSDMPTALFHIVSDLDRFLQQYSQLPVIADPSCPTENFNHRWDQDGYANFRNKINFYKGKIEAAYLEPKRDKSVLLWQEVFGSDFKKPPDEVIKLAAASLATPATEKFIDRDYHFPIELGRYKFRIVGRVHKKAGFRNFDLPSQGNRVRKGRAITFRVAACDVPEPYKIYWKVRNTGDEAAKLNALRGEIREDSGSREHTEQTLYSGSHWVEAYVVKGGRVVARDRQLVWIP
jgi:Second Messenger Oligonucleotide or Dinucleotide Synthetase domain/Adenylyl/Guanylyl and SMODS C-terminal sensor domain